MRNSNLRAFLIALMLLVFAAGLAFLLYPSLWGAAVDQKISLNAQGFLNRDATEPTIPEVIVTIDSLTEQEETRDYPELWADIRFLHLPQSKYDICCSYFLLIGQINGNQGAAAFIAFDIKMHFFAKIHLQPSIHVGQADSGALSALGSFQSQAQRCL